jgi:apolipoprotein D and lipocalin family protein
MLNSQLRVCFAIISIALAACASQPTRPLATVAAVDLARYAGRWYEIASILNKFQAMCVADTLANYRSDGDQIRVNNRCHKQDGSIAEVNGIAKIVEGSGNAKLRVSFFRPFYGDYWVLALDPDYQWVLVGEPRRKFGWVLSRATNMSESELQRVLDRAVSLGYPREAFRITPHQQTIE